MLHDIGKIILSYLYPDQYRKILIEVQGKELDLKSIENHYFGVDHEEVGGIYAKIHRFPPAIQSSIRYHGSIGEAGENQISAALIQLANFFAHRFGLGFSGSYHDVTTDLRDLDAWPVLFYASRSLRTPPSEEELDDCIANKIIDLRSFLENAFPIKTKDK